MERNKVSTANEMLSYLPDHYLQLNYTLIPGTLKVHLLVCKDPKGDSNVHPNPKLREKTLCSSKDGCRENGITAPSLRQSWGTFPYKSESKSQKLKVMEQVYY